MNGHNSPPIQEILDNWNAYWFNWLARTELVTTPPSKITPEEDQATHHLIQFMLDKNAIQETTLNEGDFVSTIFLRWKPKGSFTMIP